MGAIAKPDLDQPEASVMTIDGTIQPFLSEGLPMQVPHPLPVPVAIDLEGNINPAPRVRLGVACIVQSSLKTGPPQLLEIRIELLDSGDPQRTAWLAEISSLLAEWIEDGPCLRFHTLPFQDQAFGQRIVRHALLGVETLQGDPLWAHPAAIQADLLPFDYPAGQERRRLGPTTQWRLETILNLAPIAASTGLPLWHHAAADCLRYQRLDHPERGQKILAECAANLVKSGQYPQAQAAYDHVRREYQDALRTILGFEGLPWPTDREALLAAASTS